MTTTVRRLTFERDDVWQGIRIGGRSPVVVPFESEFNYLGTFAVGQPGIYASVFVTENLDLLFEAAFSPQDGGAVRVVVHKEPLQGRADAKSFFQGVYRVVVGPEVEDCDVINGEVYEAASGHKLGGRPYLIGDVDEMQDTIRPLDAAGFEHALQLDVPGGEDPFVREQWPFPNGVFHLYISRFDPLVTRWFWEF